MRENAYSEIVGLMREAGAPGGPGEPVRLRLGTVLSAEPLRVDVAGTTQEGARFHVSRRLLAGYGETVTLRGGRGGFSANGGTHGVSLDAETLAVNETRMTLAEPALRAGDAVLLLTEDDQTFYLVDKVVKTE